MRNYLVLPAILVHSFATCSQTGSNKKGKIINESQNTGSVIRVIAINKVWAGHPPGFSLLTSKNRQYIAYYNADRNMVAGQRNLTDSKFSLSILPATSRETAGGTSTILSRDSHNSVTLGIDPEGFLHLSGNMQVNPVTSFRSTIPYDISTLRQEMTMVGTNEDRCTYPNFMSTREGELVFHYRDGVIGNDNEIYNLLKLKKNKQ